MACGISGEYGENLLEHCMDYHHTETPDVRHQCFCGALFDGMQGFYLHFREQHAQLVFVCRRCLRLFRPWHVARDHSNMCASVLTNGH